MSAEENTILYLEGQSQVESDDEFDMQVRRLDNRPLEAYQHLYMFSITVDELLRQSVTKNRVDRVRRLIKLLPSSGAKDLQRRRDLTYTALCAALEKGGADLDVIRALCEADACDESLDPDAKGDCLKLAERAVLYNRYDELEEMRHYGVNMSHLPGPFRELLLGDSCRCGDELIHASFHGDVDTVRRALSGASKEPGMNSESHVLIASAKDPETKKTALKYAAWRGHCDVVEALLAAGVPADFEDDDEYTPLAYAVCSGHNEVVRCLLEAGASANQYTPSKAFTVYADTDRPLLQEAIRRGDSGLSRLLVHFGASPGEVNSEFYSALLDAVYQSFGQDCVEAIDVLLSAGADIDEGHMAIDTSPLWRACGLGNWRATRKLVAEGTDVNMEQNLDQTPLMEASRSGSTRCIRELLLSNRVDIDAADCYDLTSLHHCSINNNISGAVMLLQAGIDRHKVDENNQTAAELGECEEVSQLIRLFCPSLQDLCSQRIRRSLPSPITESAVLQLPLLLPVARQLMFL